ncbi:MAG: hypothetical protein ACI9Y1_003624 [Lentisphaeria bacterium]|jgi:hypothetical protein
MLSRKQIFILPCIFLACALAACNHNEDSVVASRDIPTSQFFATFEIYSDSSSTVGTSAQLTKNSLPSENKSGDEYVELVDSDRLWLSSEENLREVTLGGNLFEALENLANPPV